MYSVEDIIEKINHKLNGYSWNSEKENPFIKMSDWDKKFIKSVSHHSVNKNALTISQIDTSIKIIRKHLSYFDITEQNMIESIIDRKITRLEPRVVEKIPREARWASGPYVLFRFNYNDMIVADLRNLKSELQMIPAAASIYGEKIWKVLVDSTNAAKVMNIIQRHNFDFDDNLANFFVEISNNKGASNKLTITENSIKLLVKDDPLAAIWISGMEWLND
jgi:hypothetical protein